MLLDLAIIIQLFVLLNPLSSVPFLISAYNQKLNVKSIALKSVFVAFILAVIMVFIGPTLFSVLGISINSLRVAGGIVLLLLGISMVRPPREEHKLITKGGTLIALIATPLLTGPATISFIMVKVFELGKISVLTNVIVAFILVGIVFTLFSLSVKNINEKVIDITSRILGLLLSAVAIEMIAKGVEGLIKGALGVGI